ncbi:MAG: hypothetical protein A2V90_02560 [Gammaproteobacteria bacterium RBG_16_57_12]|nr:MAG: hypothetical protein A2V90_02560 [Gammaproteobacteria bacterium RBG_16_57_12]
MIKSLKLPFVMVAAGTICLPVSGLAQDLRAVTLNGLVEVEATGSETFAGVKSSDITLATVEIAIGAQINSAVDATIVLLHEDDDTEPMELDVGIIRIHPEGAPFIIEAGRLYVSFGRFETNLISDPLTHEIAETREAAISFGVTAGGFYGSFYTFNGEIDEAGANAGEDLQFGAALGFAMEGEGTALDVGVGYISALNDSDTLQERFDMDGDGIYSAIQNYVGGYSAHLAYSQGPLNVIAEYVTAADPFDSAELTFNGQGAEPSAYNLELGYNFELGGKAATLAIAQQATDESQALGLPETRALLGLSMELYEATCLAAEFARDEDYSVNDGGTGNSANTFTLQLAVSF